MVENVVTQLFLALGVIVLAAEVAGYVSRRLGQPAALAELVIGKESCWELPLRRQ